MVKVLVAMPRETSEAKTVRLGKIIAGFQKTYPDAHCELTYANPLQLLTSGAQVATSLIQQYLGLGGGNSPGVDPSSLLNTGLDFYNEYVWSSRGGSQEIKHTITSTFDQVYTANNLSSSASLTNFEVKLSCAFLTVFDFKLAGTQTQKQTMKYSYSNTASVSFDITASFDGIESDTQMRYSSNNDAHFVMNYNSMFNPNNQSGLNLVVAPTAWSTKLRRRLLPALACRCPTTWTPTRPTCSRNLLTRPATPTDSPARSSLTTAQGRPASSGPTPSSFSPV